MFSVLCSQADAQYEPENQLVRQAIAATCAYPDISPVPQAHLRATDNRKLPAGATIELRDWELKSGQRLRISIVSKGAQRLIFADVFDGPAAQSRALIRGVARGDCRIIGGRLVEYADSDRSPIPTVLRGLGPDLTPNNETFPLNPDPPTGQSQNCTHVGLLDNGVNYLRKDIAERLAYNHDGQLIGADFWERDARPFDYGYPARALDPRKSIFNPRRHGSLVASVIIDYSPRNVCIVPVRFSPISRAEILEATDFFSSSNTRVVSVQVGRPQKWPEFLRAIERHPEILFVAAAGNGGRDLRQFPSFPASYSAPNLLVVAGTDLSERALWRHSNFGEGIVEIAVSAQDTQVKRFDGKPAALSGTSFAAPKVAAYAATLISSSPGMSGSELKQHIISDALNTNVAVRGIPVLTEQAIRSKTQNQ